MNNKYKNLLFKLCLVLFSSLLFFLAHPNQLIKNGAGFLGFVYYLPVIYIVYKSELKNVWLYGGLYGALSYGLFGYWLQTFHPLGLIIVCIYYFLIMAFVFFMLKIIEKIFIKNAWGLQWLFLTSYEYIKTLGFAGLPYGITAYTQWKNIYFIQICDLIGVFGLNLFLIFPSCWLFTFINKTKKREALLNKEGLENHNKNKAENLISEFVKKEKALKLTDRKATFAAGIIWCLLTIFAYCYGFADIRNKKNYKTVKIAAIQNNENPWKNGIAEYARNIQSLKELTDEALELYPDIDFVLWSETSVVPSILYNYYKSPDKNKFKLIYSLLSYIDGQNAVFVIGNANEVTTNGGQRQRFNSSFVFDPGKNVLPPEPELYSKQHLVPFTEYFPYEKYFPRLYLRLLNGDTHMWEPGKEYRVFHKNGLSFSTPVCFEDTFGDDCRHFVLNGARCFLNMSNDGWSKSSVCQVQHLAMSVFRSVENRVPTVRSTATGVTCFIDQNGKIEKSAPDFCATYVVGDVPLLDQGFKISAYTKFGDLAGKTECLLTLVILLIQSIRVIITLWQKNRNR